MLKMSYFVAKEFVDSFCRPSNLFEEFRQIGSVTNLPSQRSPYFCNTQNMRGAIDRFANVQYVLFLDLPTFRL